MNLQTTFERVKKASVKLQLLADETRNEILNAVAKAIDDNKAAILDANARDLARMDENNPMYDRLLLDSKRIEGIASDMRHVATLPSPLNKTLKEKTLDNGLHLRRVCVPFGVIGMIYEARPNVTFDVFSLCFKSGNACILKGGKDADDTNREEVKIIHDVLKQHGIDQSAVELLPSTHEATEQMLNAVGYIDLCIPRGSKRLIQLVRDKAHVPVIETGAGVVHVYFDEYGDASIGSRIIDNSKTRRPSVCNSLDTLLIHSRRLADLPQLVAPMAAKKVVLHADSRAFNALKDHYPNDLLTQTDGSNGIWDTEWLSLQMGICTVGSIDEAIDHIAQHGSGHSESIVTENSGNARKFQKMVDAACVYLNTPTSFTDGAQFGLGAEIGISTQKLGARGPMALEEICTYKWLIEGHGQIRK